MVSMSFLSSTLSLSMQLIVSRCLYNGLTTFFMNFLILGLGEAMCINGLSASMALKSLYGGVSCFPVIETESSMTGCNISENWLASLVISAQFFAIRSLRPCVQAQSCTKGRRESVTMLQKVLCTIGLTFGAHVVPGSVPMYAVSRAAS